MNYRLMLVGSGGSAWGAVLRRAVTPWAAVHEVTEEAMAGAWGPPLPDLVIIDAGEVADAVVLTTRLREENPGLRIVIATASPTWERARAALKAGAADYVDKTLDETAIGANVRAVLGTHPAGRARNE